MYENLRSLHGRKRDYVEKESYILARALRDRNAGVTLFANDVAVSLSNNQAASHVRIVTLHQKISGSLRSVKGVERLTKVRSYVFTAVKHPLDPLEGLDCAIPDISSFLITGYAAPAPEWIHAFARELPEASRLPGVADHSYNKYSIHQVYSCTSETLRRAAHQSAD